MKWDIPQFKALIDGLCDHKNANQGPTIFGVLADAFDEANDERGRLLRSYLKNRCYAYSDWNRTPINSFYQAVEYVKSIDHLHPYEIPLRGISSYDYFSRDGWIRLEPVVPGALFVFEKSLLKILLEQIDRESLFYQSRIIYHDRIVNTIRKAEKYGIEIPKNLRTIVIPDLVVTDLSFESIIANPTSASIFSRDYP